MPTPFELEVNPEKVCVLPKCYAFGQMPSDLQTLVDSGVIASDANAKMCLKMRHTEKSCSDLVAPVDWDGLGGGRWAQRWQKRRAEKYDSTVERRCNALSVVHNPSTGDVFSCNFDRQTGDCQPTLYEPDPQMTATVEGCEQVQEGWISRGVDLAKRFA